METLIAEGIGKSYKGRQVVRGVDLKISRGEVVGLLGPNGAGKTTSFYIIVGLVQPDTGRVMVDQTDITRVPMYLRATTASVICPRSLRSSASSRSKKTSLPYLRRSRSATANVAPAPSVLFISST